MASSYGCRGNVGRCFPYWQEFSKCMADASTPSECVDMKEDYMECLHHRKYYTRMNAIEMERQRRLEVARKTPDGGGGSHH